MPPTMSAAPLAATGGPAIGNPATGGPAAGSPTATASRLSPPLIEIRDLTRVYVEGESEHVVLRGASAAVGRGELAVLLGRSGSGKSTLLNLLAGIDLPTAGEVVIDGVALSRLPERERTLFRRDNIGFVFQFFNLIPTLTVEENLLLPLELKGLTGAAERQRALALLGEVGLAGRARSFPDRLSGGEQQRLAVARALVHDPLLVLADEPTGNLDLDTGLEVLDLLDRLTRRAGKTMVMVTHSPEVVGIADRVFRIEGCRLVESGAGAGASVQSGAAAGKADGSGAAVTPAGGGGPPVKPPSGGPPP
jgi:putative ABC transport system ATP-binding protein